MITRNVWITICIVVLTACSSDEQPRKQQPIDDSVRRISDTTASQPPTAPVRQGIVLERYPHDTLAFTQGLSFWNGQLYESTGQYGVSDIRIVDKKSGRIQRRERLPSHYFGEGSTCVNGRYYMLTWLNQKLLTFDAQTLKRLGEMSYTGEGWGLTTDGELLYMSNGTEVITVRSADDFSVLRSIVVTLNGKRINRINELEWIEGEIWANVWQQDIILRIDPKTGMTTEVLDLTSIYPVAERTNRADVLNGIAYDAPSKSVYVTGKYWPWLYKIQY